MALVPLGSPPPNVAERSIFPGNGLNLSFDCGSDVGEPRIGPAGQGVEEMGTSAKTSRHGAMPIRSRVLVRRGPGRLPVH
jgi:hypothetical protein